MAGQLLLQSMVTKKPILSSRFLNKGASIYESTARPCG
jgi:hypothetical protein